MVRPIKLTFIVIFLLLCGGSLFTGGYYAGKLSKTQPLPSPSSTSGLAFTAHTYAGNPNSKPKNPKIYKTKYLDFPIQYPTNWTLIEHPDNSQNSITLYFELSINKEHIKRVKGVLDCNKRMEMGFTERGLCYEGSTLSALDFNITKNPSAPTPPTNSDCHKAVDTNKIIYSCLQHGFVGEPVDYYEVYFSKGNTQYVASFTTPEPYLTQELIQYIDASFY